MKDANREETQLLLLENEFESISLLKKYFTDCFEPRAVLGFDILGYSLYESPQQEMIPLVCKDLLESSRESAINNERWLFQNISTTILEDEFISLGDGGFQLLSTPLHAIIFACYFKLAVEIFNLGLDADAKKLRRILGPIRMRFSLSYGNVFRFEDSFYGLPIISASRMMAKDKLDRFLLDDQAVNWFDGNCGGIETFLAATLIDISKMHAFKDYEMKTGSHPSAILMEAFGSMNPYGFRNIILQRLGTMRSKNSELNVFNTLIQVALRKQDPSDRTSQPLAVSVGNLHSADLAS